MLTTYCHVEYKYPVGNFATTWCVPVCSVYPRFDGILPHCDLSGWKERKRVDKCKALKNATLNKRQNTVWNARVLALCVATLNNSWNAAVWQMNVGSDSKWLIWQNISDMNTFYNHKICVFFAFLYYRNLIGRMRFCQQRKIFMYNIQSVDESQDKL